MEVIDAKGRGCHVRCSTLRNPNNSPIRHRTTACFSVPMMLPAMRHNSHQVNGSAVRIRPLLSDSSVHKQKELNLTEKGKEIASCLMSCSNTC